MALGAVASVLTSSDFWNTVASGLLDGGSSRLRAADEALVSAAGSSAARSQMIQQAYLDELAATRRRNMTGLLAILGLLVAGGVAVVLIRRRG